MAFTAALQGAMLRNARGKNDGVIGTILLESSTVKPYGKIVGKFVLRTDTELKHFGIRVQFEAVCNLQFETKFDSRVTQHKRQLDIIAKSMDSDSEGYQVSNVMVEIVEARPTISENQMQTWQVILAEQPNPNLPPARPHVLHPGIHNFGFELIVPGDVMPAPFRSPYGSLVYKVCAYIKNENAAFVQIADKSIRFPGHHNLSQNEDAEKPINIERTLKKSVFSSKKFVTVELNIPRSGYLPEEDIPFAMGLNNPKSMPLSSVVVSLLQKITYNIGGATKTTTNTLDTKDYPVKEPKTEFEWHGKLKIKRKQIPTFTLHPMYSVTHTLTYKVQVSDYGSLKGEAPIYIGTTRESAETLEKHAGLSDDEGKGHRSSRIKRQASSASTVSTASELEGMATMLRTPDLSPTHERSPEHEQVLEAAKQVDEMKLSPTEDISTSSV